MNRFHWLVLLLSLCVAGAAEKPPTQPSPTPSTICVVGSNQVWTVEELSRKALNFLREKGVALSPAPEETVVHIFLDEPSKMCEVFFLSGFGKPVWRVQFASTGKVTGYTQEIMREGTAGLEKQRAAHSNILNTPSVPGGVQTNRVGSGSGKK